MFTPQQKPSSSFVCYSDLYKDVYDRAISKNNNYSTEITPKIEAPQTKP